MYEKYNAVLRASSGASPLVQKKKNLCGDNMYATTIHAINSCVIKLSKLTQAVKVWRGFKGATLPRQFFEPNDAGVRGGIEYGFSSTTTDRAQAVHYASGSQSTIFEMQMGMVDRGADLTWLSQYPFEKEVLFPPLTGLECTETEVDGSTLLVITRLSLNMASLTLEQVPTASYCTFGPEPLASSSHPHPHPGPCSRGGPRPCPRAQVLSRRRNTLMDMAVGMKGEISQFLLKNPRLADTAGKILHRALEYGQFARSPDWFNDDMNFAAAVQQALSTKSSIIASCMALPLDRADVAFASLAHLATAPHESRKLLLAGWLHSEPAATTIDFRDMSLSADEAAAVAACLAPGGRRREQERVGHRGAVSRGIQRPEGR